MVVVSALMADTPAQDRKAGLARQRVGGRFVTKYEPELALKICEQVAEGRTLKDICNDAKMPHRSTFNRWVVNYPELSRAYGAAREVSAYSLEEEALELGREIRKEPGTSQKVRAFDVLMNQLRWSASRRNPQVFSEKGSVQVTVPIQINTALDLGEEVQAAVSPDHPNIYELTAEVETEAPAPEQSDKPLVDVEARQKEVAEEKRWKRVRARMDEKAKEN